MAPERKKGAPPPAGYCTAASLYAPAVPGTAVLLGLSGGADSVTLLDLLLAEGLRVYAAHLNHGIRGAEADRDEEFCRELCSSRDVPLFVRRADISAVCAETGEGTEEAARRVRYAFFAEIMKKENIRILCTAHNADDNAETVLFRLTRGTAARGACGIPPVRRTEEGMLLRPLLCVSKAQILAYCAARGLSFVTDSTNSDITYARNRIRAAVIPELQKINPDFLSSVTAFSESLRADGAYLDSLAADFLAAHTGFNGRQLAALPLPVASRVLYSALRQNGASPEHGHIMTLLDGVRAGKRVCISVPGGLIVTVPPKKKMTIRKEDRTKKTIVNGDITDVQHG